MHIFSLKITDDLYRSSFKIVRSTASEAFILVPFVQGRRQALPCVDWTGTVQPCFLFFDNNFKILQLILHTPEKLVHVLSIYKVAGID